jgi:HD-GYP domain-containing protein (c-di-GMP phosphodiesterase class II)
MPRDATLTTRLADLLGGLSLTTDLAVGMPVETSLRVCVIATHIGRLLGLAEAELSDVYYTALLRHLGCTGFAHEAAGIAAGDDHDFLRTFEPVEATDRLGMVAVAVRRLAAHAPTGARAAAIGRALTRPSAVSSLASAHCAQAAALATDLAMPPGVVRALAQVYERFDGRGDPGGLRGEAIEVSARILHVANLVLIQHRHGGRDRAVGEVRRRRGGQVDPSISDAFLADAAAVWPLLEHPSIWEVYLDAEPDPPRRLNADQIEPVALAFARYVDLKIPDKLGHSPAVAELAARAAEIGGLSASDVASVRLAALVHDLGIVSVPNGVWEKRGPLNIVEWERVRLHPYYTERILARVPSLALASTIAVAHHERADASGYPRGVATPESSKAARLLAGADVFRALLEPRSHRAAHSPSAAARVLRDEVRAGRLCAWGVDCVLAAAGQAPSPEPRAPGGLTPREIEVVVQLARGSTNKEIAGELSISARTVQHHLEHVYAKIGVTTRAAAALFAVRHGIVPAGKPIEA